jgi:hypothetical protein
MAEMMHYHRDNLLFLARKYSGPLFPYKYKALKTLVADYDGEIATNKAIKGHRTEDIRHIISMRSISNQERKNAATMYPFQFAFPQENKMEVKI